MNDGPEPLARQTEPIIDSEYLAATAEAPLHWIYGRLEPHLPAQGVALDMGFGAGTTALWLASRGLSVTAYDVEPLCAEALRLRVQPGSPIEIRIEDFSEADLPTADVVTAGFSLFMVPRERWESTWSKIVSAIRPGGWFAGQFFGPRDEWNDGVRSVFDREEVGQLLSGFEPILLEEHDREGRTVIGLAKRWHVFHVIAQKLPYS